MKIFLTVFCLLMSMCLPTNAMLKVSDQMLGAAQEYGKSRTAVAIGDFTMPWTVNESLGKNIYAAGEKLIVYTPYLVVAMDAQNKAKAMEEIKLSDSRLLASDYEQVLVIGAIIDSPEKTPLDDLKVVIEQGEKMLAPYHKELVAANPTEKVIDKPVNGTPNENEKIAEEKTTTGEKKALDIIKENLSEKLLPKEPAVTNGTAPSSVSVKMPVWNLQYYFYFEMTKLDTSLPLVLKVEDKSAGEREFRFHLANMD